MDIFINIYIPVIAMYPLSLPEGPICAWNVVLFLAMMRSLTNGGQEVQTKSTPMHSSSGVLPR